MEYGTCNGEMDLTPSKGIMITNEYDDAVFYKAVCGCGDITHSHSILLEYDGEIPKMITMRLFSKFDFHVWRGEEYKSGIVNYIKDKFNSFRNRVKYACKVLFVGEFDWDEDFVFESEEQIKDYIVALTEGLAKMKKVEKKTQRATIRVNGNGKKSE